MTKDELMQLASKSGLTYLDGSTRADFNVDISEQLTEFANAILERAAAVCSGAAKNFGMHAVCGMPENRDQWLSAEESAKACSESIRSLKIKEGE